MTTEQLKDEALEIISEDQLEAILAQDGWEVLELTVRHRWQPQMANAILQAMEQMEAAQ